MRPSGFLGVALALYGASLACYAGYLVRARAGWLRAAFWTAVAAFAGHTIALIRVAVEIGRSPSLNAYTSLAFFAWAVVLFALLLNLRYSIRLVGLFVVPIAAVALGLTWALGRAFGAAAGLPAGAGNPPVYGFGLAAHASFSFLGYAGFALSFAAACMYLAQERQIHSHHPGALFERLPALGMLERVVYDGIRAGWVLLTVGLASGVAWNLREAGALWSGSAKEVASLAVWLLYGAMWLMRWRRAWSVHLMALAALAGFALVLFGFAGVNVLFPTKWHRMFS